MSRLHGAALFALAAAVASAGCGSGKASAAPSDDGSTGARVEGSRLILPEESPQLSALSVAAVERSAPRSLKLSGVVAWNEDVTVRIFSPFAGRVDRVLVDAGQSVSAGDVLATIAAPDFGQAQADAHRAMTDLALAEQTLARLSDLLAHGVVAQKDVEVARADASRARAENERAQARLALYGGDATSVNQLFPLKTPLVGTVVERNLNPGQEVRPDQMLANAPQLFAPLFIVSDPARLWVLLDLPEPDVGALRLGGALRLHPLARPERSFGGRVTLVSAAVDPATRTVKVRGSIDDSHGLLKAGMLVTVDAPSALGEDLTVPVPAVVLAGDAHVVFVEESRGRYRRAEIRVDAERGGVVPVTAGLKAGERVVTAGSLLLEQLFQTLLHS